MVAGVLRLPTVEVMTPETIAVIGDCHGNEDRPGWIEAVVRELAAEGIKRFIQAGDFGFWPHFDRGLAFLASVSTVLTELDCTLVFVDGNHENHDVLQPLVSQAGEYGLVEIAPNLYWAPRGTTWEWEGVKFLAVGGAPSIDADARIEGVSWWRGETLRYIDIERCFDAGEVDVIISHDCPAEVQIPYLSHWAPGDRHRETISEIVRSARPHWLFHGHYHRRMSSIFELEGGQVVRVEGLGYEGSPPGEGYARVELEALRGPGIDPVGSGKIIRPFPGDKLRATIRLRTPQGTD